MDKPEIMKQIAVITCHKDPDYVRARVLRGAVKKLPGYKLIIVKNKHKGLLRYPESILQLLKLRITKNPDVYLATFRAYEILPFLAVISWPKPLIYDEFVNPLEWLREPGVERWAKYVPWKMLKMFYKLLVKRCKYVLADTESHANYSSKLIGANRKKYKTIPVGTDEDTFKPLQRPGAQNTFQVLYYGNMRPLHGLKYVLEAASKLGEYKDIKFLIVGGGKNSAALAQKAKDTGANVTYESWVKFELLPEVIASSAVCLAGPYGDTVQARYVVTGKAYQFLASAVPTIIGKNAATSVFNDKKNCLLVEQANTEALATAIKWAYEHKSELTKIGNEGRKTYEKYFSNREISKEIKELLSLV